jgi:hypothetical protein
MSYFARHFYNTFKFELRVRVLSRTLKMTDAGWYSQLISLNSLYLVKFYICKPKSTGRGSLIKKQTIFNSIL